MFRANGQKISAAQHLANFVWGTALGGLVLVAEERRRQVGFAQRVIENGIKLRTFQAQRQYHTAAAILEAELYDERGPQQWRDSNYGTSQTRTSDEKPTRSSRQRLIRDSKLSSPANASIEHQTQNPTTSSLYADSPLTEPSALSAIRRYAEHLQNIVAERIRACLSSESRTTRYDGIKELSAYVSQVQQDVRPSVFNDAPPGNAPRLGDTPSSSPKALNDLILSLHNTGNLKVLSIAHASHTQTNHRVSTLVADARESTTRIDQQSIAFRIKELVQANELTLAFYEFLALCEYTNSPLHESVLSAIRILILAYRTAGLFSIVLEVELRTLLVLGDWRLVYEHLKWLVQMESPSQLLDLLSRAMASLIHASEVDKAFEICSICVQCCKEHKMSENELCDLVSTGLDHMAAAKNSVHSQPGLYNLHQECLQAGLFDAARVVFREFESTSVARCFNRRSIEKTCGILIRNNRIQDTLELYLLALNAATNAIRFNSLHRKLFWLALQGNFWKLSCNLVSVMPMQTSHIPLGLLNSYIEAFTARTYQVLVDKRSSDDTLDDKQQTSLHELKLVAREIYALAEHLGHVAAIESLDAPILAIFADPVPGWSSQIETCDKSKDCREVVSLAIRLSQTATKRDGEKLIKELLVSTTLSKDAIIALGKEFPDIRHDLIREYNKQGRAAELNRLFDQCGVFRNPNLEAARTTYVDIIRTGSIEDIEKVLDELLTLPALWSRCIDLHKTLLIQYWFRTQNLDMVERAFRRLLATEPDQQMQLSLQKNMLRIYLWARRTKGALETLDHMVRLGCTPKKLSILANAMQMSAVEMDWNGVDWILLLARGTGYLTSRVRKNPTFLNRVFTEYCRQHTATECVDFASRLKVDFRLSTTQSMNLNVVHKIASEENALLLLRWQKFVGEHGPGAIELSDSTLSLLVNRLGQKRDVESPTLSSREDVLNSLLKVDNHQQLTRQWDDLAMAKDGSTTESHGQSGLPSKPADLEFAIEACIVNEADPTTNDSSLMKKASNTGASLRHAGGVATIAQIKQLEWLSLEQARWFAFEFYRRMDQAQLRGHHHVTLAAAAKLTDQREAEAALLLLVEVAESKWAQREPFGLPVFTLCLRVLSQLHSLSGIERVVRLVLEKDLRIDARFMKSLAAQRRRLDARHTTNSRRHEADTKLLSELFEACRKKRMLQRQQSLHFARLAATIAQSGHAD